MQMMEENKGFLWEDIFSQAQEVLFSALQPQENLLLNFSGEMSQFIRLNKSLVRQITWVEQGTITLELSVGLKKSIWEVELTLDREKNEKHLLMTLGSLRKEVLSLPDLPFYTPLTNEGTSREIYKGQLPTGEDILTLLASRYPEIDLAGYLASGLVMKGNANNLGQRHWFQNISFNFDYSLYSAKEKAVKGSYAGTQFTLSELENSLQSALKALKVMDQKQVEKTPGKYRAYLAPAALAEIAGILSWGGLSGSSYHQGDCPLAELFEGKKLFSPLVNFYEDFSLGLTPRTNGWGEVAPDKLPIVENGVMKNLLINRMTAAEYKVESNKASKGEGHRSFVMLPGDLKREEILETLGTGFYLSNLHYLNWSDRSAGRITGMTRFGCLWVEEGKIIGPIKDLRFDETLYHIFGEGLSAITDFSEVMMESSTYEARHSGGMKLPGILVDDLAFTL